MLLTPGEKVHVMHRTFFEKGGQRTLIGVVDACEAGVARVRGHIYATDASRTAPARRPEEVTRFISLVTGDHIVTPVPESVDLDKLVYQQNTHGLQLADGAGWQLVLSALTLH